MTSLLFSVVAALAVAGARLPQTPSLPLVDAIKAFNARAVDDPVGKDQPPLTEQEVLAAIRWWAIERKNAPVSDAQFAEFQRIVETRQLPAGTMFEVLRGYRPSLEREFAVWSVRIRMPHGLGSYAYRIRERMISSRIIGPEERKVIETWEKRRYGSFERPAYFKELEEGLRRDEAARKPNP